MALGNACFDSYDSVGYVFTLHIFPPYSLLDIGAFDLTRTLEMDPEFLNTDGEHEHDTSVSSVSITQEGLLDLGSVQEWITPLLQTKGADIYRMKGVLNVKHAEQKFVYHVSTAPVSLVLSHAACTGHRTMSGKLATFCVSPRTLRWLGCRRCT